MAVRDGGLQAAVPAIMTVLIAGIVIAALPCVVLADPAHETSPARSVAVDPWASSVIEAARRFAIPERWIRAVMRVESDHDPHAVSPKGAMGLMQIMPATWQELHARYHLGDNPFDPRDNILAGAAYLAELHDLYGSPGFLAAYNAGPARYEQHLVTGDPLPTETVDYMAKIVPMIDHHATVAMRAPVHSSRSEWLGASLFVSRVAVRRDDDRPTNDHPPGRPPNVGTITHLSVLAPPSDGLFVRRSQEWEARP